MCCDGTMGEGWWMADIVEDAVGPDEKAGTAWDRALLTPDTGSALELGHGLLAAFFFGFANTDTLLLGVWAALVSGEGADTVDVEDDPSEEEEFDRWICFRGMNIRDTSSAPSPELYHPKRGPDCTLGGDATAVMEKDAVDG